jgi:hypothetical protein
MATINSFPDDPWLPVQVATDAASHGIGFGMQGLTQSEVQNAETGQPCYAAWCTLFAKFAGSVPLEVQTFSPSQPDGSAPTGSLTNLLNYVIQTTHAQILELYPQEWMVANDPTWAGYSIYHSSYEQTLAGASSMIGGTPGAP